MAIEKLKITRFQKQCPTQFDTHLIADKTKQYYIRRKYKHKTHAYVRTAHAMRAHADLGFKLQNNMRSDRDNYTKV